MLGLIYIYSDGESYDKPPSWKSDDYDIREKGHCERCDSDIIPHYCEPFASCDCMTQEWFK